MLKTQLKRCRQAITAALLACCAGAGGAHGVAADAGLLAAAQQQRAPLIASLSEMVLIESGSGDGPGLARMADLTESRLRALGAATTRRRSSEGPGDIVTGVFKGSGGKRIMLMAHMDTVFKTGILATQPLRIDAERLWGPGVGDDKGGIAVILHTLKMLRDAGWRDYATLTVLFNPDEEAGSRGSLEQIAALGAEQDVVFSCEPTLGEGDGVLLASSGFAKVTMDVAGRAAHAGVAPGEGRNALIELAHQLLQTRDVALAIPGTQLNWTIGQAGLVGNQIPDKAQANADLRYTVADGVDKVEAALRAKVATRLVPDTETTISVRRGRPPFVANPAARALALRAQGVYGEIGRQLTLVEHSGGGTDASHANRSGKAAVLESLGLAGGGFHTNQEYIVLDSIVPRLYLLARMLQEAARGAPSEPHQH